MIPDKQYFKIGEVARIVGVQSSVLRFWETEFQSIRPAKSRGNQRVYSRQHVFRLLQIKKLLYEQKYTIAGARQWLLREHAGQKVAGDEAAASSAEQSEQSEQKRQPEQPGQQGGDGTASCCTEQRAADVLKRVRKELEELLQLVGE
ncbi:MAG: MerR family transcriptional regulator [Pseudomonadota bacterium]